MVYFGKWPQRGEEGLGRVKQVRKESQYKDMLSRQPSSGELRLGNTARDSPRSDIECISELSALEIEEDCIYTPPPVSLGEGLLPEVLNPLCVQVCTGVGMAEWFPQVGSEKQKARDM